MNLTKAQQIDAAWRAHLSGDYAARVDRHKRLRTKLADRQNWNCPVCGWPMITIPNRPQTVTIDHILPKAWGGSNLIEGDICNTRAMCASCNSLRGQAGHCLGVLACARAVTERTGDSEGGILRVWALRQHSVAGIAPGRSDSDVNRYATEHACPRFQALWNACTYADGRPCDCRAALAPFTEATP